MDNNAKMSLSINFNYNYPQVAREAGFKLRQYKDGPLDWRLLGALDLERIQRDQYFEQVDGVLAHIAEVPLANMLETNILDSGISKYFMLSQYAVQYLLFCRKFLDETVTDLREAYAASQTEVARLRKAQAEANNEILQLHKKITQMEAIHEVVYPCHLCTKSFISNEALNIHIGRKHQTKSGTDGGQGQGLSQLQQQQRLEKVDDLHLINTIKLELEIKQLKERLNVAEREIRERSGANSKRQTPRDQQQQQQPQLQLAETTPPRLDMKNVGIQSNLMEMKEQDDSSLNESKMMREEQLSQLQEKVREFDEWRESLRTHNDTTIAEINKKLSELTQTLADNVRSKQEAAVVAQPELDRRPSTTNLEQIVMEKVTEIGRASAEKLEQVVYHMEMNYKEKLDELEREIRRRNVVQHDSSSSSKAAPPPATRQATKASLQRTQTIAEQHSESHSDTDESGAKVTLLQRETMAPVSVQTTNETKKHNKEQKSNDDTFEIQKVTAAKDTTTAVAATAPAQLNSNILVLGSVSTEESNQTFVKALEPAQQAKPTQRQEALKAKQAASEGTDISESLDDDNDSKSSSTTSDSTSDEDDRVGKLENLSSKLTTVDRPKTANASRNASLKTVAKTASHKRQPTKSKPFTRRDAKKLTQQTLHELGIDASTRAISSSALKKSTAALNEERNQLKQKYPNFYVTRNKFKKLVDKLCSSKLPTNAEVMLKTKEPLQPIERHRQHFETVQTLEDDSFELKETKSSTPKNEHHSERDVFKQRLENILASPIRRPLNGSAELKEFEKTFDVPAKSTTKMPVPVPRKRVMFNTGSVVEGIEANSRFAF